MESQFDCVMFNVTIKCQSPRSMGAYRIAHVLRQHGWDCEVVDFFDSWSESELKQFLAARIQSHTRFVGFSYLFTHSNPKVDSIQAWIKRVYPWIKIIVGSGARWPYPSSHIDYNISGYGERAMIALLRWLYSNGAAPQFTMHLHAGRHIDANVHYPAFPPKSLDIAYEARDFLDPHEWLGIEFARGCMFQCAFCNFPVLGVRGDYSRTSEDFEQQMRRTYDEWGIKNYFVADETFNDRTEKITKFADVVERLPFDPLFTGFLRADLLVSRARDREELLRMGFVGHYYGVESFNTASAKIVGKGMAGDRIKQGLLDIKHYFQNHGHKLYRGTISLILGLPHDSVETLTQTRKWVLEHWQDQSIMVFPLEIPIGVTDYDSKFSRNWRDYGFRESSHSADQQIVDYYNTRVKMGTQFLNWEHDHMNFAQALEMADEFENLRHNSQFKIENWNIANLDLPTDMAARFNLSYVDWVNRRYTARPLIQNYIQHKLNQF